MELIEQRLVTQIESFYARQQVLAARFNAAEAQLWMQARASAVEEIIAGRLAGGQLEDNSRADRLDSEVEVRLAQLSRELRRPVP